MVRDGSLQRSLAAAIVSWPSLEAPGMSTAAILDDEYMSLRYYPESGIVHHQIKSYLLQGGFRKLLSASADLLETHRATKYLSDDRSNVVVDPEDIRWADDMWYPRVAKAGLKHWALVLPSTMVGTLQAKAILDKRRRQGLDVEAFDRIEDAMAWLRSR
jgi:hypothetical protein